MTEKTKTDSSGSLKSISEAEQDEIDEIEFPFDLSEWTVIDADEDSEDDDNDGSLSQSKTTHSDNEKGNTPFSQSSSPLSKETPDSNNRERLNNKNATTNISSKQSTPAKKVAPSNSRGSSSSVISDTVKVKASITSTPKSAPKTRSQLGNKEQPKQSTVTVKASQSQSTPSKSSSSSKSSYGNKNIRKACAFCFERDHDSSTCPCLENMSQDNIRDKLRAGHICFLCFENHVARTCQRLCKNCKGRHHHLLCTLSDKSGSKSKDNTSAIPSSSSKSQVLNRGKSSSDHQVVKDRNSGKPQTSNQAKREISAKTSDSTNSKSSSSCEPSAVSAKATVSGTPQSRNSGKKEIECSNSEQSSISKTAAGTNSVSISSCSIPSSKMSVLKKETATSGTDTKALQSTQHCKESSSFTVNQGILSPAQNQISGKMETSSKTNSDTKIVVKDSKSSLNNKNNIELCPKKMHAKSSGTLVITESIAEAMSAENTASESIQVSDLDSTNTEKQDEKILQIELYEKALQTKPKKKVPQAKPKEIKEVPQASIVNLPYNGPVGKKRPSQSSDDDNSTWKKAKFEGKNIGVHSQDPKTSQAPGVRLNVNTKRIVRRFHRTTQTTSPTTANKISQCLMSHSTSTPVTKSNVSSGIQCNIGEKSDMTLLLKSNLVPVTNTIKKEIFKAALAFDASSLNPDIVNSVYKYGIRIGHVTQSDVDKTLLKDNFIKKADSYSISFWEKEFGVFDLLFRNEENFVSVCNQIRRIRIGPRYLCVTVIRNKDENDKDSHSQHDYFKATVIFDQNFISSGFLSYYKSPIWSKPKVDEFITLHNVPGGIPLTFLSHVFPDAITVLMNDVKLKFTRKGSIVRLGMNRKNGSGTFLKLFTKVLINDVPIVLSEGRTEKKDIPELKEITKIMDELEKMERERRKEKMCIRTLTTAARDINKDRKVGAVGMKTSGITENISLRGNNLPGRGKVKGLNEAEQDANSDLSDISELSFSDTNLDGNIDKSFSSKSLDSKSLKRSVAGERHVQKKPDTKKSLSVTVGSKLLNRARSNFHQSQSRRLGHTSASDAHERRFFDKHTVRSRNDSPNRHEDSCGARDRQRTRSNSLHRGRSRERSRKTHHITRDDTKHYTRMEPFDRRSSEDSASKHGPWNENESNYNRSGIERNFQNYHSVDRSSNRSSDRDISFARNSDRAFGSKEKRSRGESHDRNNQMGVADFNRSSEDLRNMLDSMKPKHMELNPRKYDNLKEARKDSLKSWNTLHESHTSRKRQLSRSPSPKNRKVVIERRSFSPRGQIRKERSSEYSYPLPKESDARIFERSRKHEFSESTHLPRQSSWSKDVKTADSDFRNSQTVWRKPHGDEKEQAATEESMTISKSLFVKLLTNVLQEEGADPSNKDDPGKMFAQTRNQQDEGNNMEKVLERDSRENYRNTNQITGGLFMNQEQGRSDFEVQPIPPPIMPPIFSSSSAPPPPQGNKFDSLRSFSEGPNSSAPPSQGIWSAVAPRVPQLPEIPFPLNTQPPAVFPRPPINRPPPFLQPPRQMPNHPHGGMPPRPGMWPQHPHPGRF